MSNLNLNSLPLEGDGVVENLFHYLWSKDELDNGPRINIPDTVIYKYRQPAYWYFTSVSGQIKKKARYNLVNIRIEEAFTRKAMGSDIVAYYLSTSSETGQTTIEYFDRTTFRDFLYNREKIDNGILQRFVEPKGTRNVMIRSIWSPKIVLLERRENKQHLTDKKFTLYERAVTYEGAEHYSQAAPVRGSILPLSVQGVCEEVVNHVAEVSFRKSSISRMALNFRVDGEDRLWLLWCTSLRLDQTAPLQGLSGAGPGAGLGPSASYLAPVRQKLPSKKGPVSLFTHCQFPEGVQRAFTTTKGSRAVNLSHGRSANVRGDLSSGPASPGQTHHHAFNNRPSQATQQQQALKSGGLVPVELSSCKSCGTNVLMDRFYRVPYKTIVAHFEHFMSLLADYSKGSMKIEWPPNPTVMDAMGRVGLGPLEILRESVKNAKDRSKVTIAAEDVEIPPMIRAAHPNLGASDYRRFRRDPMFLYKTSLVCEECYLVFAKIAAAGGGEGDASLMSLVGPAVGKGDAHTRARLREKDRQASDDHVERTSRRRRAAKQKRKVERQQKRAAHQMQHSTNQRTGFAKLHGPELPPRIDERNIMSLNITRSTPVLQTQVDFAAAREEQQQEQKTQNFTNGTHVPDELKEQLQERENAFFRDLYRNPNLAHGHPLSHMISAQGKISASKASLGTEDKPQVRPISAGKAKLEQISAGMKGRSPRPEQEMDFTSPYAKTQVVPVPAHCRSSGGGAAFKFKGPRQRSKSPTSRAKDPAFSNLDPLAGSNVAHYDDAQDDGADHRSFLLNTLQKVQDQLENPIPLEQALGLGHAADVAGDAMSGGEAMDEAWIAREKAFLASPEGVGRVHRGAITVGKDRFMAAVDLDKDQFTITVFNPKLALSQRLEVPMSVVIENAPKEITASEELAKFVVESLEEGPAAKLFINESGEQEEGNDSTPSVQLPWGDMI